MLTPISVKLKAAGMSDHAGCYFYCRQPATDDGSCRLELARAKLRSKVPRHPSEHLLQMSAQQKKYLMKTLQMLSVSTKSIKN